MRNFFGSNFTSPAVSLARNRKEKTWQLYGKNSYTISQFISFIFLDNNKHNMAATLTTCIFSFVINLQYVVKQTATKGNKDKPQLGDQQIKKKID